MSSSSKSNPNSFYPPNNARQNLGQLIVQLSTDPEQGTLTPISNVQITIKQTAPTGEEQVLANFVTDEVGQTPSIELPVPPIDYSLDPTNTQIPYATYRIETTSTNYIDTIVRGSQVFADTLSVQPIYLQPTTRFQRGTGRHPREKFIRQLSEDIVIGPATLYGNYPDKIPEAEVKPIIPGSGFITLSSVIVPEFIIVHSGSPNDNTAPNYTVPFLDYIANVASSEIYPTWPTETIKANVIAIVSFTLNRVFTEWYRNQGKSYTITNSTAYDHAFFYGRNLFDTIVPIVNEVFDIYVKRPGVLQPLLTQYCDGVKSQCPNWMTLLLCG
nr:SpoIID/LytB domain-containing protein [uncultured Cellulosilyticum sp.]